MLCRNKSLSQIVVSMGTEGTILFNHVGNLLGQIHIRENLGTGFPGQLGDFEQLIDAFCAFYYAFIRRFNRRLPFLQLARKLVFESYTPNLLPVWR